MPACTVVSGRTTQAIVHGRHGSRQGWRVCTQASCAMHGRRGVARKLVAFLCRPLAKHTLLMLWLTLPPKVKLCRPLGKDTLTMLWLNSKPKVRTCRPLGKGIFSMRSRTHSLGIAFQTSTSEGSRSSRLMFSIGKTETLQNLSLIRILKAIISYLINFRLLGRERFKK